LQQALAAGDVSPGERIVLLVTGSGMKSVAAMPLNGARRVKAGEGI